MTPLPGAVGTSESGGSCAVSANVGNRFSNTATSQVPAGTSVGGAGGRRQRVVLGRRQKRPVLPMAGIGDPFAASGCQRRCGFGCCGVALGLGADEAVGQRTAARRQRQWPTVRLCSSPLVHQRTPPSAGAES